MVSGTSYQQTRDNWNNLDDTGNPILVGIFNETIVMEEGATIITIDDIGDAFILGHNVNGKLGVTTGEGGGQVTLGDGGLGVQGTVNRVINPMDEFHERFRFNNLIDTDVSTATVDVTTDFNAFFDASGELFQSKIIFKDGKTVFFVIPTIDINGGKTTVSTSGTSKKVDVTEGKTQFE